MKSKFAFLFTIFLLLLSGCVTNGSSSGKTLSNSDSVGSESLVCEAVSAVGTHMKKRSCKTLAQKKTEEEEAQRLIRERRTIINIDNRS